MPLKFSHHLNLMDILGTSIYVLELASLTLGLFSNNSRVNLALLSYLLGKVQFHIEIAILM